MASPTPLFDLAGMPELQQRIEQQLLDAVKAHDPRLTEMTSHLVKAGGKRLRPLLCAMASAAVQDPPPKTLGEVGAEAVTGGVAVEMVHVGSLHHDDVIDEATTRHNVESINARWGNLRAIISGDFLLAKASELAAGLGTEVARLLAGTIALLCEGEVRELHFAYQVDSNESDYFAAIEGKTAALYSAACRIGAMVNAAPVDQVEALAEFGRLYGMAFQVVDDVLDVVSTDAELGKPAGHDMAAGVYTLPVRRALASSPQGDKLRALLGTPLTDSVRVQALELVRDTDGVAQAVTVAHDYAEDAIVALGAMPSNSATDALTAAARHLVAPLRS